jgi:spoIIIJ-associated protein
LVDAEGYRSRRDNSLATMAQRLGRQAVEEGKIITFEPMNPRDRRVVHLALAKFEGVITRSDGEGDDRRVQIIPVRRNTGAAGAANPN